MNTSQTIHQALCEFLREGSLDDIFDTLDTHHSLEGFAYLICHTKDHTVSFNLAGRALNFDLLKELEVSSFSVSIKLFHESQAFSLEGYINVLNQLHNACSVLNDISIGYTSPQIMEDSITYKIPLLMNKDDREAFKQILITKHFQPLTPLQSP